MDANPVPEPAERSRESQQASSEWHATFDAIQDGICLLDREGRILQCSRAMRDLVHLDQAGLLGHRCFEVLHGRVESISECPFQHMLATGKREATEVFLLGRWFEAVADPLRDSAGAITGAVHILHDVTARRQAEGDRKRLTEAYATLSQANQAIARVKSEEDLFREIVRVCVDFGHFELAWIGTPAEDGLLQVLAALGPAQGYTEGLQISIDPQLEEGRGPTGSALQAGLSVVVQDWDQDPRMDPWRGRGRRYGLRASAALPLRRGGQTVAVLNLYDREPNAFRQGRLELMEQLAGDLSYALDTLASERLRQQSEAELQASEARFRLSFDHAGIGKSLTRPDGRLLLVNEALCDMLGYTRAELEVANFAAVTYPDDLAETREYVRSLLEGERSTCRFEKRFIHKDGHIVWADVNSMLLRDAATGEPLHLITHLVDITERKQALEKIQTQLEELQRWYAAMLGREDRIQELKREVNALCRAHQEEIRYPSQEAP